jgi:RimJ/RimL family protein N-acetyltransferase
MSTLRLGTARLELKPLPAHAAAALPEGREEACRALDARLDAAWPDPGFLGVLRRQADMLAGTECFGVWVMIERNGDLVVGDIGFHEPPDGAGTVEIGYSVIPSRRRLGYAAEAANALVEWALAQPGVRAVVAGCDPSNEPSIRTLERVGFRRSGEVNGELRWRYDVRSPSAPWGSSGVRRSPESGTGA